MNLIRKGYELSRDNLDCKKAAFFSGLAGIGIGLINLKEGLEYALLSGAKEGIKSFAIGSLNLGICRNLATNIKNKSKALFYATIVPSTISITLTYLIHNYLQGTPHPVESTLPTLLGLPFFFGIAVYERRSSEKRNKSSSLEDISIFD